MENGNSKLETRKSKLEIQFIAHEFRFSNFEALL